MNQENISHLYPKIMKYNNNRLKILVNLGQEETYAKKQLESGNIFLYCVRDKVTDNIIKNIIEGYKDLQTIDLNHCSKITDKCIMTLAQHCSDLTSIDLGYCPNITDKSIITLVNSCPKIKRIGIGWFDMKDTYIRFGYLITDELVTMITQKYPELNIIDLNSCSNITDISVIALAEHCPVLTKIDLIFCSKITDATKQLLRNKGVRVLGC